MKIYIGVTSSSHTIITNRPIRFDGEYVEWVEAKLGNISRPFDVLPEDIQSYIVEKMKLDLSKVGSIGELEI